MVKTKGSKDKVKHRRTRSDKNKKRKIYAGKKTLHRKNVNGNFVSYVPKRKRDDNILVRFCSVEPMSHEGLMRFSKETRRKMHQSVYGKSSLTLSVPPEQLSTKEKIEELALDYLWEIKDSYWLLMLWGTSKNTHHCSPRAFGIIKISQHPSGLKARVIPSYKRRSLKRMFFWRDH
jgi:hypothetical protein